MVSMGLMEKPRGGNMTHEPLGVQGKVKDMELREKLLKYFGDFEIAFYADRSLWRAVNGQRRESFLRAKNAEGWHIFMRPCAEREPYYLLADDISSFRLISHHSDDTGLWRVGRTVVETSPKNYQVWIRSRLPLSPEQKLHWLRKMGSDPGSYPKGRWGRMPGFRNRKEKYFRDGEYPMARLIWVDFRTPADIPVRGPFPVPSDPEVSGAVLHPCAVPVPCSFSGVCRVPSECTRADYDCGDSHRTDFRFCLALIRRGFSDSEISGRLVSERANWENHKGDRRMADYLKRTIKKARMICR